MLKGTEKIYIFLKGFSETAVSEICEEKKDFKHCHQIFFVKIYLEIY